MDIMKMLVVILVFFNFFFPASFAPLANNLNSGNPPGKVKDKQRDDTNSSVTGGGVGTVNQSKFAHGGARGGGGGSGGHSAGEGGHSPRGGGAAVIPVYAAGAAGQRNNHHGAAGICSRCRKDMLLITSSLTSLLLYLSM